MLVAGMVCMSTLFLVACGHPTGSPPSVQDIELKYGSDTLCRGGSGGYADWSPLVEFTPPVTPFVVKTAKIGACLSRGVTAESVVGETFEIEIWDENLTVLSSSSHLLNKFRELPKIGWVEFDIDDVEVNGKFYVLFWLGDNYDKVCLGTGKEAFPYSYYGGKKGVIKDKEEDVNREEHPFTEGWKIKVVGSRAPVQKASLQGPEILKVRITEPGGSPMANMEVDLWTASAVPPCPPDVGRRITDADGVATFHVPAGDYKIGFNGNNFPLDKFAYPRRKKPVTVNEGIPSEVTIQLHYK
jgi:hypothetical protein